MNIISPIEIFIALFIGMGPVKVLLIFIAMTEGMDKSMRRKIAKRTAMNSCTWLVPPGGNLAGIPAFLNWFTDHLRWNNLADPSTGDGRRWWWIFSRGK